MKKFEKFALTGKQATQIVGGKWIYYSTSEGRGAFNDKNGNGQWDQGESWYFIYKTQTK
ncbi:MAG TPA: hypothetical protein VLB84_01560 [Bacteroidia bacterium]|nr:hypothetical protein [Bacteroidia bacterium]